MVIDRAARKTPDIAPRDVQAQRARTLERTHPAPGDVFVPSARPRQTPAQANPNRARRSGGGLFGGIGRFFSSVGRGISRAVGAVGRGISRAVGAVGNVLATGARYAVHGAQYVAGGLRGLVAGGLYRLGIDVPGLVPPRYPSPDQVAANDRRIERQFGPAIQRLPAAPRQMLDQMRQLGVSTTDIFHGSHVVVEDGGRLYEQWRQLPGSRPRSSSHYPGVPHQQYEMSFPGVGVVLFGRDGQGHTFFQMEAHSNEDRVNHTSDFFLHLLSGHQNVGPAGLSPHSEKEGREIRIPAPSSGQAG